uniref:Putative secreted protein n=1 Tax=Anopheles marajoara TaxID=58244 RepID=A0A2M4C8P6_9DIPT
MFTASIIRVSRRALASVHCMCVFVCVRIHKHFTFRVSRDERMRDALVLASEERSGYWSIMIRNQMPSQTCSARSGSTLRSYLTRVSYGPEKVVLAASTRDG